MGQRRSGRVHVLTFTGVERLLIDSISQKIEAAAATGVDVLVTDHYHQYVAPLVDEAYVMWQKQCYRLDGDAPIQDQLAEMGYLRDDTVSPS